MIRAVILALSIIGCLALSGCFLVYRPDVQQGNIVSTESLKRLKLGMTAAQVQQALGTPALTQTRESELIYVYTWAPNRAPFQQKSLWVYFSNGQLVRYTTNITEVGP